jgi:thymidylate kinase
VIYLDAPAEVLFARKGEGGLELLERRRQDYLNLRNLVDHFAIVDASLPEDDVARAVTEMIENFHRAKLSEAGKVRASRG